MTRKFGFVLFKVYLQTLKITTIAKKNSRRYLGCILQKVSKTNPFLL